MSQRVFTVRLSEMATARLVCLNPACLGVSELPMEKLADTRPVCPHCDADFTPPPPTAATPAHHAASNPYAMFARAALSARRAASQVRVEFVVPEPD